MQEDCIRKRPDVMRVPWGELLTVLIMSYTCVPPFYFEKNQCSWQRLFVFHAFGSDRLCFLLRKNVRSPFTHDRESAIKTSVYCFALSVRNEMNGHCSCSHVRT